VGVPARSGDLWSPFDALSEENVGVDADAAGQRPTQHSKASIYRQTDTLPAPGVPRRESSRRWRAIVTTEELVCFLATGALLREDRQPF
jgi:hypothetical protein